jgi:cell division protein FtsQ
VQGDVPARSRLVAKATGSAGPTGNRRKPAAMRTRRKLEVRAAVDACGRALRRSVPALAAVGVIAVIAVGGYLGYRYVTTSPRFAIATIEVHGNRTLTADEIRGLMTARIGDNLFLADTHAEAAALRAEPWIASADVRRELPDTLVVEIGERTAAAVVAIEGATYLADERGVPFRRADDGVAVDGLPVITGLPREAFAIASSDAPGPTAVRAAIAAIAAWRAAADRPAADAIAVADHGLTLHTRSGLAIELGPPGDERELDARLHRFDLAWSHLSADERAHAREIHVDHQTRQDHVIVAFAKD